MKLGKKGISEGVVFIFSISFVFLILVFYFFGIRNEFEFGEEITKTDIELMESNTFLATYIDSESTYGLFSDLIVESYAKNDFEILRSETDIYLQKRYGEKVGWQLLINKEEVSMNYKGRNKFLEDYIVIPGIDRTPLRITLKISPD